MITIPFNVKYHFDENLREVPESRTAMEQAVDFLKTQLLNRTGIEDEDNMRLHSLIGAYSRILGDYPTAEKHLKKALAYSEQLDDARPSIVNLIRLAHVYQWEGKFDKSNAMFDNLIEMCEGDYESLLDTVYQHAGKNRFDQEQYVEALALFEKALELRQSKDNPSLIESTEHAIHITKLRMK
jgi:tetratricopeptide (TPR) repeat protein